MEKYELVDINGNKTGKIITNEEVYDSINIPEGYYVAVVGVIIINSKNEVLFQKRSKNKKENPGKWGICGGKVNLNESTLDAAVRETLEEIGIRVNKEDLRLIRESVNKKHYFTIYCFRKDVDISKCKLQEEELEEVRYFKLEEIPSLDNEGIEWLENLKKVIIER